VPSIIDQAPTELTTEIGSQPSRWQCEHTKLATVVEQASDAILITDIDGTIQYVNPAFERVTGYRRDEVLGKNPRLLKSGRNEPTLYENLWETITRGAVWKGHLTNQRKDGTLYEVEATISPVCDDDERIVSYAAVTHDVTQEIDLELRLRQAEKMEAVGQLASGVAHDFNNLLTAILGSVGVLRTKLSKRLLTPDSIARGLDQIERVAHQGASLTRQLLAFNRRESVKLEALQPNRVLADGERMLRRLIASDIVFDLHLAEDVYTIEADAGQLKQVLMNLVVNARDAMPDGGRLTIATSNVDLDELYVAGHADARIGPHVLLVVSDTGCGMSAAVIKRIYEPFFTTKPAGKGTGLGLATVYAIVRRLGGHITVSSAPNEGTQFKIYLPASARGDQDAYAADDIECCLRGHETILVCEDDADIRKLERELLERSGYTVLSCEHARQALEWARDDTHRIDLLVADLVMPEMNGAALAEALRAILPDLRVLYVSGCTDDALAELGASGARDRLLPKPFTSRGLLRRVRQVLDSVGSRSD
jgi:two-component system cell cycle sensor histidine kinase/response regulator CckA